MVGQSPWCAAIVAPRSADIDSRDELLRISEVEVAKLQSEIEANNDGNKALDAELDKLGRSCH